MLGASGSGKSTLLRAMNGLVPHTSGGRFGGDVVVFGRSTRSHHPRELADVVGFVAQDPEAQFVVDHVERDLAFVLENLGFSPEAMRRRVEEVLDALGIAHLRDRDPSTLSGGERQRCAIAGALAAAPQALVLDEPTSQLDPQGADDVLAALARLNDDLGTTVVLAEHRLERAAPLADRAVLVDDGAVGVPGRRGTCSPTYPGAPSVTRLGRLLGWDPLPLTVRDARARAALDPPSLDPPPPTRDARRPATTLLHARGLRVALGGRTVVRGVDLELRAGDVDRAVRPQRRRARRRCCAALAGLTAPSARHGRHARVRVAYVPQNPNTMLFSSTVRRELVETPTPARADRRRRGRPLARRAPSHRPRRARTRAASRAVNGSASPSPRWRSAARRCCCSTSRPGAWTRRRAPRSNTRSREHAAAGGAVVLATHDVELSARIASHAVVLGDGEIVADGDARTVLAGSLFAPQVLRVLPPFLTVEEVDAELART